MSDLKIRAYHFVGATLRDGRPIPKDGEKLVHPGYPELCRWGLHASVHPFDALQYAPGATLCLVDVGGQVNHGEDKIVGTERTIVARLNATELLRYFARMQALSVINNWQVEPPDVVLDWLMTGDKNLQLAAESAARSARSSARSAAWSSAESAAWSSARSAAWSSAESAAWSSAAELAWSAARWAARSAAELARSSAELARSSAAELAWSSAELVRSSAAELAWSAARDFFALLVQESLG